VKTQRLYKWMLGQWNSGWKIIWGPESLGLSGAW
jgi:hypothetical protein